MNSVVEPLARALYLEGNNIDHFDKQSDQVKDKYCLMVKAVLRKLAGMPLDEGAMAEAVMAAHKHMKLGSYGELSAAIKAYLSTISGEKR